MRIRWIIQLVFASMIIATPLYAHDKSGANHMEIHENMDMSLTSNFVEDVLALVPMEMSRFLSSDISEVKKYSTFKVINDYWKNPPMTEPAFIEMCDRIKVGASKVLARRLGETVRPIFEVAMRPSGDDVLRDGLHQNLSTALHNYYNNEYVIRYPGYSQEPLNRLVEKLYALKKYEKRSVYPQMVSITADIWTAIWTKQRGEAISSAHTILRRPYKMQGSLYASSGGSGMESRRWYGEEVQNSGPAAGTAPSYPSSGRAPKGRMRIEYEQY